MMHARDAESVHRMSARRYRHCHAGFSLFELVVGLTIVGLLGTVLSERMLRYQEYAEKTAMEITTRNIQTGLRLQVADLMMRDRLHEIDRLLKDNPISWLETPPPNYVGERTDREQNDAVRGNWYFDTVRREVVYAPFHRRFFEPQLLGSNSIRYRITARPVTSGDGVRRIEGLSLLLLSPYKWAIPLGWDEL
jgi:prepilin-type N-terminal cleavage/methylation domain-containing protein